MKRKWFALFLALCMTLTVGSLPAFAEEEPHYITTYYNADPLGHETIFADRVEDAIGVWSDTYAYIGDDWISMVDVSWFAKDVGAELRQDGKKITMKHGDTTVVSDGTTLTVTTGKDSAQKKLTRDALIRETREYRAPLVQSSIPEPTKKDAVYYPIRDLAEAFGWTVDFVPAKDGAEASVVLFDAPGFVDGLVEKAPNLYRLLNTKQEMRGVADLSFSASADIVPTEGEKTSAAMDMTVNEQMKNAFSAAEIGMNLDLAQLTKMIGGYTLPKLEGVTIDFIQDNTTIYIKTNLFEKLRAADGENKYYQLLADVIDETQWVKIDAEELFAQILKAAGIDEDVDLFPADLSSFVNGDITGTEYLTQTIDALYRQQRQLTTSLEASRMIDMVFDIYEGMDQYIAVTEEGNKTTVKIDITTDDLIDLIRPVIECFSTDEETIDMSELDSALKEIKQMLTFGIHAETVMEPDQIDSKMNMTFGVDLTSMDGMKASVSMETEGTQKPNEETKLPEIPERAIDLDTVLQMIQGA